MFCILLQNRWLFKVFFVSGGDLLSDAVITISTQIVIGHKPKMPDYAFGRRIRSVVPSFSFDVILTLPLS